MAKNGSMRHTVAGKKTAFLAAFAQCATVSSAAEAARVHRNQHYRWLQDPEYQQAFEQARETAVDALEAEAVRRAVHGRNEPVYYQGKVVGTVQRYSDILLIFLLKGAMPAKYRDRHEITGAHGQPLIPDPGRVQLTDEKLAALIALAEKQRPEVVDVAVKCLTS